jgi:transcriptional regulator with XRE-family HTH domain
MQSIYTVILKEIRRERRCNQQQLAHAIRVSPGTVTKFESGALALTFENLLKISYRFGYSVDEIHAVAEKYGMWLRHFFGYEIYLERINNDEDDLMKLANEFYKSEISKKISENYLGTSGYFGGVMRFPRAISYYSIHSKPKKDFIDLRNVFRYITNESFRKGNIIIDKFGRWDNGEYRIIFDETTNHQEVLDYFSFDPNIKEIKSYNEQNFIINRIKFVDELNRNSLCFTDPFDFTYNNLAGTM